ncbi:MAG: hypothetical protein FWG57_07810 [Endomicrobia bacterium]|nr:hypothetical protein [Bacillota bacterium]MCL1972872.1 hypothetical protein [Endomicrobiia bacterium]
MNKTKIRIISHVILLGILLNASLCHITLNCKTNFFIAFSSVAGALTYCYNPIQFAEGLEDKISDCFYKKPDKQDKKKNGSNNPVGNKKNDFMISVFSHPQIKNFKQLNKFYIDKSAVNINSFLIYSLYGKFLEGNSSVFAFSFMLLAWFAVIFRKERNFFKNIRFVIKNI